jgi:hypothetical protein
MTEQQEQPTQYPLIERDGTETGATVETTVPMDVPTTVEAAAVAIGSTVVPPPKA